MFEYHVELLTEIRMKVLGAEFNKKELDQLNELINQKAADGWELVTHSITTNTFAKSFAILATFRREKETND